MIGIMGRRRKVVVKGAVLDLTGIEEEGEVDIEALLAAVETKAEDAPTPTPVALTDEELLASISDKCHCCKCCRSIFTAPKIWKGQRMCANCHKQHRVQEYPKELTEYIRSFYRRGCVFCDTQDGKFHLDHINMFNKVGSVGNMLEEGMPAEDIIAEIGKCQLLCVNCHALVTKFEWKRGFIADKKNLNKKIARGEDVSELRQRLYDTYGRVMTRMYPLIREKANKVWGVPVVNEGYMGSEEELCD